MQVNQIITWIQKMSIIFADDESLFSQNYRSFFQAAAAVRVPRGVLASAVEQN
jgi:hypothetical protein